MRLIAVILTAAALLGADSARPAAVDYDHSQEALICCGADEVFIIPASGELSPVEKTWSWRASDSPEITEQARSWFRTTDECKPYEDTILITSSSGGVALVRREDKRAIFVAYARNAHSACLLPGGRIAVASSVGGDEVLIFQGPYGGEFPVKPEPVTQMPEPIARYQLPSAHGVFWDEERSRLWALGYDQLLLLELRISEGDKGENAAAPELQLEQQWPLPSAGGHDLSPSADENVLFVTTEFGAYSFNVTAGEFTELDHIGTAAHIKSVDQHPTSGRLVYHQASDEAWWSDTIRFAGEELTIRLPEERLYKVRWDVPRESPSPSREAPPQDEFDLFVSAPDGYFDEIKQELRKEWPDNRRVVFVAHGHSVPAGFFRTPEVRTFDAYPSLFHQSLAEMYPTAVIETVVTAIGGETSDRGSQRFAKDVLSAQPDVVMIDYCLNDRRLGLETAEKTWRSMIEACRDQGVRVILLTPTPDSREEITDPDAPLAQYAAQVRELAKEYDVAVVDSYGAFQARVAAGSDVEDFLSQVNHPNRDGHQIVADLISRLFLD